MTLIATHVFSILVSFFHAVPKSGTPNPEHRLTFCAKNPNHVGCAREGDRRCCELKRIQEGLRQTRAIMGLPSSPHNTSDSPRWRGWSTADLRACPRKVVRRPPTAEVGESIKKRKKVVEGQL